MKRKANLTCYGNVVVKYLLFKYNKVINIEHKTNNKKTKKKQKTKNEKRKTKYRDLKKKRKRK